MKFTLLGYQVSIVSVKLVTRVETLAKTYPAYGRDGFGTKISRIKAYREIIPGSGLKEAKDWVEDNFV